MKKYSIFKTIIFFILAVSASAFAIEKSSLPFYSTHYSDESDPFSDARAAIKLANESQRNVLIEIGGNWCVWCQKMDVFFEQNPDLYKILHQRYVVLKINVSDVNENADFMKSLPPVLGYPHMYVSTSNGKMMLSKDTAEFLEDGEHSRDAWQLFLDKWQVKNNVVNLAKINDQTDE